MDLPSRIWKKMTSDEQMELVCLQTGPTMYDGKGGYVVLMGSAQFKRIQEYKDKMIEKYERKG